MLYAKRVLSVAVVLGLTVSLVAVMPSEVSAQRKSKSGERVPAPKKASPGQKEFDRGIQLLEAGQIDKAISQLEVAVAKNERNPQFHVGLVHAYATARKSSKAWNSLRRAVELDDKNPALGVALVSAWQSFGIEGLFNVGQSANTIAKALGKADKIERHATHERWIYGFMALNFADGKLDSIMDLRGLTRELLKEEDRLTIQTDGREWKAGHRLVNNVHTTTEYTLPDQQVQNWKELVTVERLLGLNDKKVDTTQLMDSIKKRIQSIDPKAEWKVIKDGDDDVMYEWRFAAKGKRPAHHEMARLIKGKHDIYRIAYSTRAPIGNKRKEWANLLNSAALVQVTSATEQPTAATKKPSSRSPKTASFELGSSLGLSMALHNASPTAGATQKTVDKTRVLARNIGKQLPKYPELSGNRSKNQSALLKFAVKTVGSPFAKAVRDRYGDGEMELFEMGLKSNLLLSIYQPGQSTAKSIAKSIEKAAESNNIPKDVWNKLVVAIEDGAPFAEIKGHVMALNRDMNRYLEGS